MASDNIHEQMAQYDFQAPLEVTMIFEENEEDELPEVSTIKLEKCNNFKEGNDNSSFSQSTSCQQSRHETAHKINIELTPLSTATVEENSKNVVVHDSTKEIRVKNVEESVTEKKDSLFTIKTDHECELDLNSKKLKNNNKETPNNRSIKPKNSPEPKSNNKDEISILDGNKPKSNNKDEISILDGNNNNKHLNDLDNTTLMQINAKVLKELLKTVSDHLLIIIKEHLRFLQHQNDKSINLYTLDGLKHCYLRLKYHYFDLSYCTVSTILLSQENNAGFITRFLNHTLQVSKEKELNCTYKILETLYIEMIDWAKAKKKHLARFSSEVSNHNENIMLKQQLHNPSKKIPFSNLNDLHNGRLNQNTCIFTSGPPGRQVQISVEPSLINQNGQEITHGTTVSQQNRQLSQEPSSIHQINPISDKSSLVQQIGQPRTVEPLSIYQNSQPSMVEPSLTHQKNQQISTEPSLIHQNRWHCSSEPWSIQQLKKQQLPTEPTTSFQQKNQLTNVDLSLTHQNAEPSLNHQNKRLVCSEPSYIQQLKTQLLTTDPTFFQQNSHLSYVDSSLTYQNAQQINAEPSLIHQNRQQNNLKVTESAIQKNIQHASRIQWSIQQLNKQQFSNEPCSFQQNNQLNNGQPSTTHLISEQTSAEPSLIQQNKKRKLNKTASRKKQNVNADPLPIHQTRPQTTVEQSLIHQSRQPHLRLQSPNLMQGFGKKIQHPNQCVNNNISHYNPLSYANYPTSGNSLQQHPTVFQNRYYQPNVFPNYGTVPRAGPAPPNYNDAVFRHHQQYYNDTLNQLRQQSGRYYNQEPEPRNPEELPIIDTTRSSVSKDSGIMSPLCSETCTDQSSFPPIEDLLPSSNTTPMITHVTSLNPNAFHISEGNCVVCQKSTNSKCLGCYKCYYCSHECQTKDWTSHIFICSATSDAH